MKLTLTLTEDKVNQNLDLLKQLAPYINFENCCQFELDYKLKWVDFEYIAKRISMVRALVQAGLITNFDFTETLESIYHLDCIVEDLKIIKELTNG